MTRRESTSAADCPAIRTWPTPNGRKSASSPNFFENIPKAVFEVSREMMPLVTSYEIEFYEVATAEKLTQRGLA